MTGCVARVSENALIRPTLGEKLSNGTNTDGRWTVRAIDIPRQGGVNLYTAQFSRPDAKAVVLTTRSEMSSQLYAAAKVDESHKELLIVPDAGHNNASKSKEYKESFERLLSKFKW